MSLDTKGDPRRALIIAAMSPAGRETLLPVYRECVLMATACRLDSDWNKAQEWLRAQEEFEQEHGFTKEDIQDE